MSKIIFVGPSAEIEFEDEPFLKDAYLYTRAVDDFGAEVVCDLKFGCFEEGFTAILSVSDETGKEVVGHDH